MGYKNKVFRLKKKDEEKKQQEEVLVDATSGDTEGIFESLYKSGCLDEVDRLENRFLRRFYLEGDVDDDIVSELTTQILRCNRIDKGLP